MSHILKWIKKDKVFLISLVIAIFTMFFVTPSFQYLKYINWHVLIIMFSIMVSIGGIFKTHFFDFVATKLVIKFQNLRGISLMILTSTFFLGMLLTNDAVLLTLIPFSVFILKHVKHEQYMLKIIALQTIAANMGSALTPMGDPQNIYIYAHYQPEFLEFISITLPITIIGFLLLILLNRLFIPKVKVTLNITTTDINWMTWFLYLSVLIVALLGILRVVPLIWVFVYASAFVVFFDKQLLKAVDYHLLLTFVSFFIITGNLAQIEQVVTLFEPLLQNGFQIYGFSIVISQVISNVPTAVLLSTFVSIDNYQYLLQGVNVGSLGSIVGSLASLIALKYIVLHQPQKVMAYIKIYFFFSIIFIGIITLVIWLI